MNQKRTPRGVPAGGQFENNDHDEARHWLSSSPAPTVPNTTSAIRRDGTAALMLPGSGRKIVLDLGASPYCESSGIYSASTNSVRLRYGVESEKFPSPIPATIVRPAESREIIAASVAKLVAKGKNPDSIYVAAKTHDGFYLVTQDEAA